MKPFALLFASLFILSTGVSRAATSAAPAVTWATADRDLARIKAPTFPAKDFPITAYGAVAGTSDSTAAIAKAIAACHAAGGGRVVVPAGEFSTGAIHLKSNVNLHVSAGATLRFNPDPALYPVVFTRWEGVECMNYSPLHLRLRTGKHRHHRQRHPRRRRLQGHVVGAGTVKRGTESCKQRADRDRLNEMGEKACSRRPARLRAPATSSGPTSSSPTAAKTSSSRASPSSAPRCGRFTRCYPQNVTVRGAQHQSPTAPTTTAAIPNPAAMS